MSKQANGRASDPLLRFGLLVVLDHGGDGELEAFERRKDRLTVDRIFFDLRGEVYINIVKKYEAKLGVHCGPE